MKKIWLNRITKLKFIITIMMSIMRWKKFWRKRWFWQKIIIIMRIWKRSKFIIRLSGRVILWVLVLGRRERIWGICIKGTLRKLIGIFKKYYCSGRRKKEIKLIILISLNRRVLQLLGNSFLNVYFLDNLIPLNIRNLWLIDTKYNKHVKI